LSEREDEAAAIRAVLAGNEAAFRALYRAHAPALYRLALRMTGGSDTAAEDVVQEAWARAVRGLARLEARASLATWLGRITTHCALERIRWERRGGEALPEPEAIPSPGRESPLERVDLERAFEALPPGYRAVLVLHDVEGFTHEEIGGLLELSPGTSKSQLSRARAWLRRALGNDYAMERGDHAR
jgi:RNA polymerase sigma-70 factor (ECF subfamily)